MPERHLFQYLLRTSPLLMIIIKVRTSRIYQVKGMNFSIFLHWKYQLFAIFLQGGYQSPYGSHIYEDICGGFLRLIPI